MSVPASSMYARFDKYVDKTFNEAAARYLAELQARDMSRYGARGITICAAWLDDFGAFREWALASGYRKSLTIDREDSDGHYEPSNCRWIPKGEQQANTRWAVKLTVDGVTRSCYEWARISGIRARIINGRSRCGWPHKRAVFEPVHQRCPR